MSRRGWKSEDHVIWARVKDWDHKREAWRQLRRDMAMHTMHFAKVASTVLPTVYVAYEIIQVILHLFTPGGGHP